MIKKEEVCKVAKPYHGKNVAKLTGYYDIDVFLDDCLSTMQSKGHDYRQGNDNDLLHNFRTVGETVGLPMEKVWFTYFYKHYSALTTFIKEGGQSESEPIEGRIKDMIVYLLLFYRMTTNAKRNELGDTFPVSVKFPELNPPPEYKGEKKECKMGCKCSDTVEVAVNNQLVDTNGRPTKKNTLGTLNLDPNKMKMLAGVIPPPPHVDPLDNSPLVEDNIPESVVESSRYVFGVLNERDEYEKSKYQSEYTPTRFNTELDVPVNLDELKKAVDDIERKVLFNEAERVFYRRPDVEVNGLENTLPRFRYSHPPFLPDEENWDKK